MPDPLFGKTWKMNPARSVFSTAAFKPQQETRLYEEIPNGYKLTVNGSNNGIPYSWNYTALYDGKPHPVNGRLDVDAITIYKINQNITVGFFTKGAADGGPYSRSVSADGKSLSVQAAGRHVDGSPFYDVIQYQL